MWEKLVLFCVIAIPVSIIDVKKLKIPDTVILIAAATFAVEIVIFERDSILFYLTAALLCFLLLLIIRKSTNGLGMGDVKFGIVIGLACGPMLTFLALMVASFIALSLMIPLLVFKKIDNKTKIPFGPFLCLGTIVAIALGSLQILHL